MIALAREIADAAKVIASNTTAIYCGTPAVAEDDDTSKKLGGIIESLRAIRDEILPHTVTTAETAAVHRKTHAAKKAARLTKIRRDGVHVFRETF